MSRKSQKLRYVRVLAHWQTADSQTATHVPRDIGEFLVSRMVCERISQKVIRMFAPEAVFAAIKMDPEVQRYIPDVMPPAEVENVQTKGFPLPDPASNIPRMQPFARRRPIYGLLGEDWRHGDDLPFPVPASV